MAVIAAVVDVGRMRYFHAFRNKRHSTSPGVGRPNLPENVSSPGDYVDPNNMSGVFNPYTGGFEANTTLLRMATGLEIVVHPQQVQYILGYSTWKFAKQETVHSKP